MTRLNLLQGTLDLIVLKILSEDALHGYAVAQRVRQISKDRLQLEEGSLYPALYRMEKKGWIPSRWREADTGRRARVLRSPTLVPRIRRCVPRSFRPSLSAPNVKV